MQQLLAILLFAVLITSSSSTSYHYASCKLTKSDNNEAVGRVDLREESNSGQLEVQLKVDGSKLSMAANSKHGFHVHTYGNISGGCGTTGGHYNPHGRTHGNRSGGSTERHVGDFGNVEVDENGDIDVTFTDTVASLEGVNAILGRAFVLHAGEDDLGKGGNEGSLASGNAGARLACCVIGWASGEGWTTS